MSKRPYNPAYHHNIVDNCRSNAKAAEYETKHLSDEQVYDLYMEAYFCESADETFLELVKESWGAL